MSFFSAIRVALAALLVNKGRSGLTSLGIVIGISAVIAMVSAGDGARAKLDERLESVGKNLILIRPGARTQQGMVADFTPLTSADADAIKKQVGDLVVGVAKLQFTQRVATTGINTWPTDIVGCDPEVLKVRKWKLTYGQFFTEDDVKKMAPVCLIGQTVRKKLFPDKPNPVGQTVRVDRLQLRIVGVLAEKGRSPTGADQDNQIFIPLTTLQRKLVGEEKLSMILTAVRDESQTEKAKEEILHVLREKHHVKPGQDKFDVSSVQEMSELALLVTRVLQVLVAVIASISLVVGGIGIMNIMLVSVTERTREIGIRMAVGATPGDILTQFLIEAVVLAMVGGVIGITLGIAGAIGIAKVAGWDVVISPFIVVLACVVAAGVGVFFGFYPAQKASRLDPIEALRYE
jgi:putative ABC transport system permease protein